MAEVRLLETDDAAIVAPPAGKHTLFFDTDGLLKSKAPSGTVTVYVVSGGGGINAEDVVFTPVGTIAAADVQAAIAELDSDVVALAAARVAKAGDTMSGDLQVPRLGVGTAPSQLLHVQSAAAAQGLIEASGALDLILVRCDATLGGPAFRTHKGRGSVSSPAQANAGDQAFSLSGRAFDNSATPAVRQVGRLDFVAKVAPTAADSEGRFLLLLTPSGTTSPSEVIRVEYGSGLEMYGAGNVVIDANRNHRLRPYTIAGLPPSPAAGTIAYASDAGGGNGVVVGDGSTWRRMQEAGTQTRATDADFTLTCLTSAPQQFHEGTLTAARTVTLSTTNAYDGARFRITRTGAGAFNLNVAYGSGGGSTKALATNAWADFVYSASAGYWKLAAAGTL